MLQYTQKALDHWREWLPKMYKEMKADGTLNQRAQDASKEAALMESGAYQHEAEEIVLPELILLPPEK